MRNIDSILTQQQGAGRGIWYLFWKFVQNKTDTIEKGGARSMKIGYQNLSKEQLRMLSESGLELFPFDPQSEYDAVLYAGDTIPRPRAARAGTLMVHYHGQDQKELSLILKNRMYSPLG